MSINIKSAFHLGSGLPLDDRLVVNTLNDLYTYTTTNSYIGMLVYVLEDSSYYKLKLYMLDKANNANCWVKMLDGSGNANTVYTEEDTTSRLYLTGINKDDKNTIKYNRNILIIPSINGTILRIGNDDDNVSIIGQNNILLFNSSEEYLYRTQVTEINKSYISTPEIYNFNGYDESGQLIEPIWYIYSDGEAKFDTVEATEFYGLATSSINDSNDQKIVSTYIKNITSANNILTITKGDDTTKNINIGNGYYLPLSGGNLTGNLTVNTNKIQLKTDGTIYLTNIATTNTSIEILNDVDLNDKKINNVNTLNTKFISNSVSADKNVEFSSGITVNGNIAFDPDYTPTLDYYATNKKYVDDKINDAIVASDAMIFKGTLGTDGTITKLPTTYKTGWTYRIITAGTYASNVCEIGDLIIALVDRNGSGNLDSDWTVAQTNINGAITNINATNGITSSKSGSTVTLSLTEVSHTNSTSTIAPAHKGTFTALKSITTNNAGQITDINTQTITLPADNDTHWTSGLYVGKISTNSNSAELNNNVYLKLYDNSILRQQHLITGSGATSVTSNESGAIIISSTDTNTLNTTGATNNTNKLFIVGSLNQNSSSVTYSNNLVYINENQLYSNNTLVATIDDLNGYLSLGGDDRMTSSFSMGGNDIENGGTINAIEFKENDVLLSNKYAAKSHTHSINGLTIGTSSVVNYAICSTEAATVAKTVNCTGFSLIVGSKITVKFTNTNTATNPTLNVNNTGAKPIYYKGQYVSASNLIASTTYNLVYNGTQYDIIGTIDTNTHYTSHLIVGASNTAKANASATNGNVYLNLLDDSTLRETHNIVGTGSVTVTSDANGKITINGVDNNTDTKVTNTLNTTTKAYITGTTSSTTNTGTQIFDSGVYLGNEAGSFNIASKLNIGNSILEYTTSPYFAAKTEALHISGSVEIKEALHVVEFIECEDNIKANYFEGDLSTDYLQQGTEELIFDCGNSVC